MRRRFVPVLALALAALALPGASPSAGAQQRHELRIATLAPRGSGLVRAFRKWDRMLERETDGQVGLKIYAGGVAGDEKVVIRKIRAGQLDGAAVTTTGLGMLVRKVLVLSAPGLIDDYGQLDAVRGELEDDFDRMFRKEGYELLGWGDMGKTRMFSKKRIAKPSDLRSARPWVWKDNPIMVHWLKTTGANGVPLGVPEVYPGLQTGMIDTVLASALSSVALQWFTKLKYVSKQSSGVVVGALVLDKETFDALPADARKLLRETARQGNAPLRQGARRMDARAYRAITERGVTPVDIEPHRDAWESVAKKTRERLAGRLYPKSLLERVARIAERHR
ncbi:MAG: TRAP transporter substrate-binding protein DctP [Polyangiales bacterium]